MKSIVLMGDIMLFYLVGIKGSALSALAKILVKMGHIVQGVDVAETFYTLKENEPMRIESFANMNLKKSYYYIIGNAYVHHSVTKYIQNMKYRYAFYPVFLTRFFNDKKWICVSGTSGKTTTTKMIAHLLPETTSLIGDGSYSVGNREYFIIESCEYRNTFLEYNPYISLILNVNYDHVDFFQTKEAYVQSFIDFARKSKICILNGDEFSYRAEHVITFGMKDDNDVVFTYDQGKVSILRKNFYLPIRGLKYAYDFVGAYLVAKLLNENDYFIQSHLNCFVMPKRRFEKIELKTQIILTDYAHHPQEIAAVLEALNEQYPKLKKICIFEPHTLSRLACFIKEYYQVLHSFDQCYMFSLFSSVREGHNLVLENKLYQELGIPFYDYHTKCQLQGLTDCVICFLGAGTIDKAFEEYKKEMKVYKFMV